MVRGTSGPVLWSCGRSGGFFPVLFPGSGGSGVCMDMVICPACPHTWQEGPLEKNGNMSLLVCEIYPEAFPIRHSERCMTARTSVAGNNIVVSFSRPSSRSSCHADVSGRIQARTAVWIFMSSASCSLGNFFPRKSDMYLSTSGARVTSRSGLGCSLNRASLSSFVRHRLRCLSRYFTITFGTFMHHLSIAQ